MNVPSTLLLRSWIRVHVARAPVGDRQAGCQSGPIVLGHMLTIN